MQQLLMRWKQDVYEMLNGITSTPFSGRSWSSDFEGEVSKEDIHYSIFLCVVTIIPAAIVAYVSTAPTIKVMAQFFGAPLQAVISGFLTSSLLFLGSHTNKTPRPFPTAYKLMLRIMSVYPFLRFFIINPWTFALSTLIYGFFVVRGATKTFQIPQKSAILFFGITYLVFALLQLQSG